MEQDSFFIGATGDLRTLRSLALEPELESLTSHYDIDEITEKAITEINEALKRFKHKFHETNVPTSSDIREIIKEQHYFKSCKIHWFRLLVARAKDAVVCYLIAKIRQNLSVHDTAKVLSHTENGNTPLILDMIDNFLWKSAVLTIICGIDPDHYGRTYEDIVQRAPSEDFQIRDLDHKYVGLLLKLCATCFKDFEQYIMGACITSTRILVEGKTTSNLIGRFLGHRLGFEVMPQQVPDMAHWKTPQFNNDSLHWYHIPFTNGSMVQVLLHIYLDDEALEIFHEQFRLSPLTPGDPYLSFREHMYWASRESSDTKHTTGESVVDLRSNSVIVFPTIMLTTLMYHIIKKTEYVEKRQKMVTRTGGKFSDSCTMHLERTLDEAYFPGLDEKELSERNKDQIVSREYTRYDLNRPLVIVPQLWLWTFGDILVSAHGVPRTSERYYTPYHWQDERLPVSHWKFPKISFWKQEHLSPHFYMARLISQYITSFGSVGITPPESIRPGEFVEKSLECLNDSKKTLHIATDEPCKECVPSTTAKVLHQDLPILDYFERHVVKVLTRVKHYMGRSERNQIDYEKEKQFHRDLSDCRSELAMILHILRQQKDIIIAFRIDVEKDSKSDSSVANQEATDTETLHMLDECLIKLKKYEEKVFKIDGDAERVEKSVQDLLNLKRTYTTAQDSHAGVLLGVAAGAFAIVTIFFAPLAFLTALFALNIQGFERLMVTGSKEVKADAFGPIVSTVEGRWQVFSVFGSVILTFVITGTLVFAGMKWLNIDFKDLKFERDRHGELEDTSIKDKEEKPPPKLAPSTLEQERNVSIRETSPEEAKKTGLAAAFSVARKRLSTKKDIEAQ